MKTRKLFSSVVAVSVALSSAGVPLPASGAAGMTGIGVAGAVKGLVRAVPGTIPKDQKAVGRIIQSGKPLYLHEHVVTGPGAHLQIMLKDETIFTIGPNSDIVLDEFVYNPQTDAGKVTASVSKGVFRFITGNIGKKDPSQMEVKLPAGTIGIRGTIIAGRVSPAGESLAVLLGPGPAASAGTKVGAFLLSNSEGSVFVDKPGFGSSLNSGAAPTPPAQIPADQMKGILGDLSPKTVAERMDEGKQMMAERLAQKLVADDEDSEAGEEGRAVGTEGSRQMSESERKLAEKMMSGEPLDESEQAQARESMKQGNMSETEMLIAEKMIAGETLTPSEQQQVSMMIAGEHMMEHMGAAMTPEQIQLAQNMMAGNMSLEQQQAMMQKLSPEQQALMGEMMPPAGMDGLYQPYVGGDPNAMLGGHPEMMGPPPPGGYLPGDYGPGPYGDLAMYDGTQQFFSFYDPNFDPNLVTPYYTSTDNSGGVLNGPTDWGSLNSQITNNVVSGTGYFPAQSGAFNLNMCNAGACTNAVGTWGFDNTLVNFADRTISGRGYISGASADGVAPINDSKPFSVDFNALTGPAVINVGGPVTSGGGGSQYFYGIGNGGGIPAHVLTGNVEYTNPGTQTSGTGDTLVSVRVDGNP